MMKEFDAISKSIRSLSIDAIEKAKSGHPGLPLGAAELATVLYAKILRHNPKNPNWIDRDRFVLSAGHGSMLLYSILHIAGYDISLDEIKNFRTPSSKCPGHPEYGHTPGVEATTGPLGQGIAMATGMAVAEKMLEAKFNTNEIKLFSHYIYALVGEGCLMEGISNEACSFAGNNKLNNLIVFYDKNQITIDGSINITFTDDIQKRYESYGWYVQETSMYEYENIEKAVEKAKAQNKPSLIILNSIIGKGAPTVQGTSKAHGSVLGKEGCTKAKQELGLDPEKYFYVDELAYSYFNKKQIDFTKTEADWNELLKQYEIKEPEKYAELKLLFDEDAETLNARIENIHLPVYSVGDSISTRSASGKTLSPLALALPQLVGGSADLEGSNCTKLENETYFSSENYSGRSIHFGIREFAMAAICNGIKLHKPFIPFCATFLCFSDYLKPALRLSALMKTPVVYIFSHDSFYVGEDGPTHQPVEMLAGLRATPNCFVLRPADAEETQEAWKFALRSKETPVCLILSRQNLPVIQKHDTNWKTNFCNGGYVVHQPAGKIDVTILATGSEVSLALDSLSLCKTKQVQIISVTCKELFEKQSKEQIEKLLNGPISERRIITCEAGSRQGWEHWCKDRRDCFSLDEFGISGEANEVAKQLSFTAQDLANLIER
ncbi:MAG: transketolase [Spirochaetaceae bacterium]|nr:transketolase [Spirochaetaceae bacterium]